MHVLGMNSILMVFSLSLRCYSTIPHKGFLLTCVCLSFCYHAAFAWIPFADHSMMNGGGTAMGQGLSTGLNPFGETPGGLTGEFSNMANPYGSSQASAFVPPGYNSHSAMNAYRSSSGSIGSICYCDVRINKLGSPGDLLFKLHYPTINAQSCQLAIQQCATACKTQAQRQLTGNVLFEEGGLENLAPDKDVSVGTVLCKEHGKIIAPPGVIASVFAKPDACGRAQPIYDLTGEESRLCCTLIAHPYIRTEHVLVFSPECIAGVAPPAPAAGAAAASGTATAGAASVAPPAQVPEAVPVYNHIMPQFRHYDHMNPMNAMMNAFG